MSIAPIVRAMVSAGCSPEQILAAVEAAEAEQEAKLLARRTKDAERQRRKRHAESRDVTRTHAESHGVVPRARVDNNITNSLPNSNNSGSNEPSLRAREKAPRKHLLPEDFEPKPSTFAKALADYGASERDVRDKVEALREWSHGKVEKRADWDLVLLGAIRRDHQRQATGPPNGRGKQQTYFDLVREIDRNIQDADDNGQTHVYPAIPAKAH